MLADSQIDCNVLNVIAILDKQLKQTKTMKRYTKESEKNTHKYMEIFIRVCKYYSY